MKGFNGKQESSGDNKFSQIGDKYCQERVWSHSLPSNRRNTSRSVSQVRLTTSEWGGELGRTPEKHSVNAHKER